jgi:uncharacterized protein
VHWRARPGRLAGGLAKHLLVDGTNILHAWPELRALLARDREAARSRLSSALAAIHDAEGMRVTLVFDGRGPELVLDQPSGQPTFTHAITPSGLTADDVIERMVGRSGAPADCLVATDDRAERATVEALGAGSLSAADLAAWTERAAGRLGRKLAAGRRENERRWRDR